jgi:hypothetical protein
VQSGPGEPVMQQAWQEQQVSLLPSRPGGAGTFAPKPCVRVGGSTVLAGAARAGATRDADDGADAGEAGATTGAAVEVVGDCGGVDTGRGLGAVTTRPEAPPGCGRAGVAVCGRGAPGRWCAGIDEIGTARRLASWIGSGAGASLLSSV